MWGKIMIPMYRLSLIGLYGLYGPRSAVPRKAAKFNHSPYPWWPSPMTPPMTLVLDYVYLSASGVYPRLLCSPTDLVVVGNQLELPVLTPKSSKISVILVSGNGLCIGRCNAIIWENADLDVEQHIWMVFYCYFLFQNWYFLQKMRFNMSVKCIFCLCLNVLTSWYFKKNGWQHFKTHFLQQILFYLDVNFNYFFLLANWSQHCFRLRLVAIQATIYYLNQ